MGRKISQQTSTYQAQQAIVRQALQLDQESDVFLPEDKAGLTAQQWQAIGLLVAGVKAVDVAQQIGCTQETVSRWRSSPVFAAALNLAVRDSYSATIGEVRSVAQEALSVLRECLKSEDERLRLSAALAVLRLHLQLDGHAASLPVTPAAIAREKQQIDRDNMLAALM